MLSEEEKKRIEEEEKYRQEVRSKQPRKTGRGLKWFLIIIALFLMTTTILSAIRESAEREEVLAIPATFDVPSLYGKNVDEIKAALGKPKDDSEPTELQLSTGVDEWTKQYQKGGNILLITYNPKTRKAKELFLGSSSGTTDNKGMLLRIGNLSKEDVRYTFEFVEARNAAGYTGVIIREL